jgi:hypothetical protein
MQTKLGKRECTQFRQGISSYIPLATIPDWLSQPLVSKSGLFRVFLLDAKPRWMYPINDSYLQKLSAVTASPLDPFFPGGAAGEGAHCDEPMPTTASAHRRVMMQHPQSVLIGSGGGPFYYQSFKTNHKEV